MAATGYQMLHNGEHSYTTASASPGPADGHDASRSHSAHPGSHRRTYQACIPCRRRKVRCDLGEVDNPHEPPCGRCRRESKECFFSATRRKKNTAVRDDEDQSHEVRTTRKRRRTSASVENDIVVDEAEEEGGEIPRTPGGSVGRFQPLRRPAAPKLVQYKEEEMKASEETAALLQRNELHGGHDALKLLYVAANHMRDTIHARTPSHGAGTRPNLKGAAPTSHVPVLSPDMESMPSNSFTQGPMQMFQSDGVWKTKVGADGTQGSISDSMNFDPADYAVAHRAWSRFRFVRAGWFTAKEGIDYILYFYKYLSPLTPVILPNFTQLSGHKKLLEEEPMLAVTMLVIASRHMRLPGPGSHSRPYALHDKFYRYLDGMIKRVIWGQEQFGGGFCGAGAQPGCDVNPLTRKGLRTLGTVESLLLLTEWHPRAMHFPPDDDDDELMVPDEPIIPSHVDNNSVPRGAGGHRMDAWLEPIWRSDRMCWMLTGMAMSLAFEIGVFDKSEWKRHTNSVDQQPLSPEELAAYDLRRTNVRDVLLIFVTLTSGRVGLTSMLPSNYSKPQDSELCSPGTTGPHSSMHQVTLHYWLRMAAIMRDGNQQIFANKEFTRQLIRDNKYRPVLERLRRPLELWRQEFDSCSVIPQYMRHILKIEFEYARVYLYAIALQAVVERCVNELAAGSSSSLSDAAAASVGATDLGNIAITPGLLARKLGEDRPYALAVGDAARNLLRIVVDGLAPKEYLRHAPVRTYFRIISTAIVLLKTFALGASESDVAESLTLMDRTIDALRNCIVDDVHVACRFADLLQSLTQNLKPRLVRMAADGRAGRSRRASRQATQPQTPDEEQTMQRNLFGQPAQATPGASNQHQQQQWYGNGNNNGNALFSQHGATSSRPMYGLPDEIYDLTGSDNQYTVMPPPGFSSTSPASANPGDPMVSGVDNGGYDPLATGDFGQDYYTLDLNPILSMPNGDIDNSMFGVQVNGRDLLEVLWDHPQDGQQFQPPMNSMGYQGGTNGLFNGTNGYH